MSVNDKGNVNDVEDKNTEVKKDDGDILFYHVLKERKTENYAFDLLKDYIEKSKEKLEEQSKLLKNNEKESQRLERERLWKEQNDLKKQRQKEKRLMKVKGKKGRRDDW